MLPTWLLQTVVFPTLTDRDWCECRLVCKSWKQACDYNQQLKQRKQKFLYCTFPDGVQCPYIRHYKQTFYRKLCGVVADSYAEKLRITMAIARGLQISENDMLRIPSIDYWPVLSRTENDFRGCYSLIVLDNFRMLYDREDEKKLSDFVLSGQFTNSKGQETLLVLLPCVCVKRSCGALYSSLVIGHCEPQSKLIELWKQILNIFGITNSKSTTSFEKGQSQDDGENDNSWFCGFPNTKSFLQMHARAIGLGMYLVLDFVRQLHFVMSPGDNPSDLMDFI